jgi:hypothetical protein
MYNYLICTIQNIKNAEGNDLGNRVCEVSESTFPVSDDYEWKQYDEYFDVYTGQWYWDNKPIEYIHPIQNANPASGQPAE